MKTTLDTTTDSLAAGPARFPAARAGLWGSAVGTMVMTGMVLNTAGCVFLMALLAPIKLLSRKHRLETAIDRVFIRIGEMWIGGNNVMLTWSSPTRWHVQGVDGLERRAWYLIMANHQSWVDILVLQRVFNRRIPFMKFFIKQELIWMPLLGFAWWILDFPFMKRSVRGRRGQDPQRRLGDLEVARRACARFRRLPVSVMNFAEGTRFTPAKQERQRSPFRYLLRPKGGGAAMVLSALNDRLSAILDVTIVYPAGAPTFWELVCGRIPEIHVNVREVAIDPSWSGDYLNDRAYRRLIQERLNDMWARKDAYMDRMLNPSDA
jgi:1-acyl-sn-glycerol-3-phosphate acyltransferase